MMSKPNPQLIWIHSYVWSEYTFPAVSIKDMLNPGSLGLFVYFTSNYHTIDF